MSMTLRARVATASFFVIMLMPIGMSSLRGLTHILSCREQAATPFSMEIRPGERPVITTSFRQEPGADQGLCGALLLDMRAGAESEQTVRMLLLVENRSRSAWAGTIKLDLGQEEGRLTLPLDLGRLAGGSSGSVEVPIRLAPGQTSLSGTVLIGP